MLPLPARRRDRSSSSQALGRIDEEGVWLEALETDPAKYLPEVEDSSLGGDVVPINLNRPMAQVCGRAASFTPCESPSGACSR